MDGVAVTSRLDAVTIYQRDAVCVRRAPVAAGTREVRVSGLPLALLPGSLRARWDEGAGDGVVVLQARPGVEVTLPREGDRSAAEQALALAREADARARTALASVEAALAETQALRVKSVEPRRGEPPREAHVDTMLALVSLVDRRLAFHLSERRRLRAEVEATGNELRLREARVEELSSAARGESAKVSRCLTVTLSAPLEKDAELLIEYVVPGVRWAPSYALELNPHSTGGTLRMQAAVAQASGEDWTGVRLALATAPLSRAADVPLLRSTRIGRLQEAPAPSGWREPPAGLEALFEAWEDMRPRRAHRSFSPPPPMESSAPAMAFAPPALPAPAPVAMARRPAFGASPEGGAARLRASSVAPSPPDEEPIDEGGPASPAASIGPGDACLDYPHLVMRRADDAHRGRLVPGDVLSLTLVNEVSVSVTQVVQLQLAQAAQSAARIGDLPLPQSHEDAHALQSFDYVYESAGRVDVPAHGTWTSVPVMTCEVGLVSRFVCVPAVDAHVFRVLAVRNGSAHALLPGPVDVTLGEAFLLSTKLPGIAPGGEAAELGLGVEEGLKVARNVSFAETSGGLLGGVSVLTHTLELEVKSGLGTPAALEILERVPVPEEGEKDITVQESAVQPPWTPLEEVEGERRTVAGGRRWKVEVPARGEARLKATYAVRIPSDRMLVGGNRRV